MLNVAVIGLGFMGATHLKAWAAVPDARLAAVVDADPIRLTGDLSSAVGNLATTETHYDFSGLRAYTTLEQALADPAIDAVDICLPTDRHAAAATAALRAGKHVLCEKPLALDSDTAEELCLEAERCGRVLMGAHVLRFFPAYQQLAARLRGGEQVRSALFRRRCAAPTWGAWLSDPARSGGAIMDLLIHDIDFCVSLWGVPESVHARGDRDPQHNVDVIHAELRYPGRGPVLITGGWHHPPYPFSMEFTVVTNSGTLDWSSPMTDLREYSEGELHSIPLGDADAFTAELTYFSDCATRNVHPDACPPSQSAMAIAVAENIVKSRNSNGAKVLC